MSVDFTAVYGRMAMGPAGPSVFSYLMHEVDFLTDVQMANQNRSLMIPLDEQLAQIKSQIDTRAQQPGGVLAAANLRSWRSQPPKSWSRY